MEVFYNNSLELQGVSRNIIWTVEHNPTLHNQIHSPAALDNLQLV